MNASTQQDLHEIAEQLADLVNDDRMRDPDLRFGTMHNAVMNAYGRGLSEKQEAPIAMLLWCPECGERHIDVGEFATKHHHTHACQITAVRPERLQDLSRDDAVAEGIPQLAGEAHALGLIDLAETPGHEWDNRTSVENYAWLWDLLNGGRAAWSTNPFVWVYTYEVEGLDQKQVANG